MKIACVIPARYASTRLPGKPLADIAGKPMIQRVYEQVSKAAVLMKSLWLRTISVYLMLLRALAARLL